MQADKEWQSASSLPLQQDQPYAPRLDLGALPVVEVILPWWTRAGGPEKLSSSGGPGPPKILNPVLAKSPQGKLNT